MKFAKLAQIVTRRGNFYKHEVANIEGKKKTWISTALDDVVITDIRKDGMINPDDLVSLVNQSKNVAVLLNELNQLSGLVSAKKLKEMIAPFV